MLSTMASLVKGLASVFLGLVGMLGILHQVQAELRVTMSETSPVQAARGSNLTLSCNLNQSLRVLLTHNVFWQKESRVKELTNETLRISKQQDLLVNSSLVTHYNVKVASQENWTNVTLQIKNVKDSDDGRYVCKVIMMQQKAMIASGEINVIVPNAATKVKLTVDRDGATVATTTAAGESSSTKVAVDIHTVRCLSEGSNPEGNVRLELDGRLVGRSDNMSISLMPEASRMAGAPRYRAQVEADLVLTQLDNGKRLSCETVDAHRNASATTLVIVAKPRVHCDDVKASGNRTNVQLVCMVMHAHVTLLDFLWDLPDPGVDNFTETATPDTEKLSESHTKASLSLNVTRWGKPKTLFRLTVVTQIGNVSGEAFVILGGESDKENESDHDGDDGDNDDDDHDHDHDHDTNDKSSARGLTMMPWNPILMSLLLLLLTM